MTFWRIYYQPALADHQREILKTYSSLDMKIKFIDKGTPCVICYDCSEREAQSISDTMWRKFGSDIICTQIDSGVIP